MNYESKDKVASLLN